MDANLICFTREKERAERAEDELFFVGFRSIVKWWSFPNPFDRPFLNTMPHTRMFDENIGFFNASRMHYRIIKTSLELGDENVIICEDDVRFMKGITCKDVEDIIKEASADILLLDGIPPKKGVPSPLRKISDRLSEFDSMRSGACYVLSRKGMERIVWLYESAVDPKVKGRKARICDQWFDRKYLKDLRLVMATPNIAVQQTVPGCHNSGNRWRLEGYKTLGIDLADYHKW